MNETEKRRLQLLQDTRKTYSEKGASPAVHPRYRGAYKSLYGEESNDEVRVKSTFAVRLIVAMLLLVMFYSIDNRKLKFHNLNSQMIVAEIQKNLFSQ